MSGPRRRAVLAHAVVVLLGLLVLLYPFTLGASPAVMCRGTTMQPGDVCAKAGESLRYRCDRPHSVRCIGDRPGRATMVCILKAAVMD